MSVSGLERLDFLAQRYGMRPSHWLDPETKRDWTARESFLFDETCALAGVRAETRAHNEARERFEREHPELASGRAAANPLVDARGRPLRGGRTNRPTQSPASAPTQSKEPIELSGPDGETIMLPRTIPMLRGGLPRKRTTEGLAGQSLFGEDA